MKKLFLTLTVLALCIFAMSSCEAIEDLFGKPDTDVCKHENLMEVAEEKASCTTPGATEGVICIDCNAVISGCTPTAPFGHRGFTTPAKPATCESAGSTASERCVSCREYITAPEVIPMLPHTVVDSKDVDPTCTESGSTGGTHCSVCFTAIEKATVIDPTGHTYAGGVCSCGDTEPAN